MGTEKVMKTNWHFDKLNKAHNIKKHMCHSIVSLHLICCVNQWTGFCIITALDWIVWQNYNK